MSCTICNLNSNITNSLIEGVQTYTRSYFYPHTFVDGVCSACGYSDEISLAHTLTGWTYTSRDTHTRYCTDPGCDYTETKSHTVWLDAKYTSDPAGHYMWCSLCGTSPELIPHEFTPWSDHESPDGWMNRWCDCGYSENCVPEEEVWMAWGEKVTAHTYENGYCIICTAPEGHVHSFPWWDDEVIFIDEQYHGYKCYSCDYIQPWPHSEKYYRGEDTHYLYCTSCAYIMTDPEPHDWGLWVTVDTYRHRGCYICGHYYECGTEDSPHSFDGDICTVCEYVRLGGRSIMIVPEAAPPPQETNIPKPPDENDSDMPDEPSDKNDDDNG